MTIPVHPPAAWFEHPGKIPTDRRITIEPDGRVYGYVKLRGSCHTGMPGCVDAPDDSPSNFGFAHQGRTMTAEGHEIETAIIAGGRKRHASLDPSVDILRAAAHYQEGVENQLMRVRYGSDENGIWFAGALWPDANELDVEHIRASPNSGDWRFVSYQRQHDFAGAVLVNIPGFAMDNAGSSRSAEGTMEALAASAGFGVDSSGNVFELYARDDPAPKENSQMCDTCNKPDEKPSEGVLLTAAPLTAAADCGACKGTTKILCDCAEPVTAAADEEKQTDPMVAAVNALSARVVTLEANERRREAEALVSEIEAPPTTDNE
jgi:hypothetical protein